MRINVSNIANTSQGRKIEKRATDIVKTQGDSLTGNTLKAELDQIPFQAFKELFINSVNKAQRAMKKVLDQGDNKSIY